METGGARNATVKAVALISGDSNVRGSLHFVQGASGKISSIALYLFYYYCGYEIF